MPVPKNLKRKIYKKLVFICFTTVIGILFISLALPGCSQNGEGGAETQVRVTPSSTVVEIGQTVELSASSSNSEDEFAWTSGANSVAVVDSAGLVTGTAEGQAVITAVGTVSGAQGQVYITVVPKVEFTATPTSGESPLVIKFSDLSTTGDKAITAWSWDFGDGIRSEESSPSHTYIEPGVYTVILTISSDTGEFSKEKADYIQALETTEVDSVVDDLQGIVFLCSLPDNGLDPASRDSLIEKIANAKFSYLSGQPCAPVSFLESYLEEIQTLREPDNAIFEELYNL